MSEELKLFSNPSKIRITVETLDGSTMPLTCEKITQDMVERLSKAADSKASMALYEQMAVFFGGKARDYGEIDARVVTQVIMFMTEQMKNPT